VGVCSIELGLVRRSVLVHPHERLGDAGNENLICVFPVLQWPSCTQMPINREYSRAVLRQNTPLRLQYGVGIIRRSPGGMLKIWYLYAILTVVTWGLWGVFSKLASNYAKPRQALLFQTAGVLAFSVVVLVVEKFKLEWNLPGFSWAALGGFFAFIGFLTFFAALEKGNTSTVVTLSALYPMVTILISIAFLHERLTTRQGIGIALALIASVLLAS
jgi:transporter family protein